MATLLALRAAGTPLPAAAVCLSPWVDLTQSSPAYARIGDRDPMVSKWGLDLMAESYLAGTDPRTELVSPLYAEDLGGLPPIRVEVGESEVLIDDSVGLAERLGQAGVDVSLTVWPEMIHVFQAFPGSILPEADQSIAAMGSFLAGVLGPVGRAAAGHLAHDRDTTDRRRHREDLRHAGVQREDRRGDRGRERHRPRPGARVRDRGDAGGHGGHRRRRPGGVGRAGPARYPSCEVMAQVSDVRDAGSVERLADSVFDHWGQVDVLCNNAGVFVGGFIWDRPVADFDFVLGVNLWGILHGIRAFVPRMMAQGTEGHVVNTASVAGLLGAPFEAPYAISKFAAFAATESLAHDLAAVGSSIKASVLCPGMITTNIVDSDRHRPAPLATEVTEDQKFVSDYLAQAVAAGMDPAEVARIVIAGIRAEEFMILTHDAYRPMLAERLQALVAGRLPGVPDFV